MISYDAGLREAWRWYSPVRSEWYKNTPLWWRTEPSPKPALRTEIRDMAKNAMFQRGVELSFSGNKKHQIHFLVKLWLLSSKVPRRQPDQSTRLTLSEFFGRSHPAGVFFWQVGSRAYKKNLLKDPWKDRRISVRFPTWKGHSCGRGPFQVELPPRYSWQGLPDALSNYWRMRTFFVLSDHNHWQLSLVLESV